MGNKIKKEMNRFGDPSSFFQILIREILANKLEMQSVDSSWIRSVHFEFSESGSISLITVGIEVPKGARTPFKTDVKSSIVNGKTIFHLKIHV